MKERLNELFGLAFTEKPSLQKLRADFESASYCLQGDGKKLQGLIISGTKKASLDLSELDLSRLEYLNLSANEQLNTIVFAEEAESFPALRHLDLSKCNLSAFQLARGAASLQFFALRKNPLEFVKLDGQFSLLNFIDISECETGLFRLEMLGEFPALQNLHLYKSKLIDLQIANETPELKVLDLERCGLERLPMNAVSSAKGLETFYLDGNELTGQDVPLSIVKLGKRENSAFSVLEYLRDSETPDKEGGYIYRSRMILIGDGNAGKTTLRENLKNPGTGPIERQQTLALEVDQYTLKEYELPEEYGGGMIDYEFSIWDFGGQGKYRELQQLFCSPKSLYLYVESSVPDDEQHETEIVDKYRFAQFWLQMAEEHGSSGAAESPVIYVSSKKDLKAKWPFDDAQMLSKHKERLQVLMQFPKLGEPVETACLKNDNTGVHLKNLTDRIHKILPRINADAFKVKYKPWLSDLIQHIQSEKQKQRFFETAAFLTWASEKVGVSKEEVEEKLFTLDYLGAIIHLKGRERHQALDRKAFFSKQEFVASMEIRETSKGLPDLVLLDPEWAKDAPLALMEHAVEGCDGKFSKADLSLIWKEKYPNAKDHDYLISFLEHFYMCHTLGSGARKRFIIPFTLYDQPAEDTPDLLEEEPRYTVHLRFKEFFPAGIVNKLIVALFDLLPSDEHYSKDRALFEIANEAQARLEEVWGKNYVKVDLFGPRSPELLARIKDAVVASNESLRIARGLKRSTQFEVVVPVSNTEEKILQDYVRTVNGGWKYNALARALDIEVEPVFGSQTVVQFFYSDAPGFLPLSFEKELYEIQSNWSGASYLPFICPNHLTLDDIGNRMLESQPHIVHIVGHGSKASSASEQSWVVNRDSSRRDYLGLTRLSMLFEPGKDACKNLKLVFFNACYTAKLAEFLSSDDLYCIGVMKEVSSDVAIAFAKRFYAAYDPELDIVAIFKEVFLGEYNGDPFSSYYQLYHGGKNAISEQTITK